MRYGIDLNARQAGRVFEQAIRTQATILLEPSVWGYFDGLKGFIGSGDERTLMVEITESPPQPLEGVRGLYCDVEMVVGGHRYMFCSDIVEVVAVGGRESLVLSRPETLQVAQRRQFWRTALAEPSLVSLVVPGREDEPYVASLYNISQDGMACRADGSAADGVMIGDEVRTVFDLPRCSQRFDLRAVVCNKTPSADPEKMILGLQFVREPGDRPAQESLSALGRFLTEYHQAALLGGQA